MAFITGLTPQGNCSTVRYAGDNHYICGPVPERMYIDRHLVNQWFLWYARIEGEVGEVVHIDLQWLVYDPSKREPGTNGSDSFFTAAHECVFTSCDEVNWKQITDVRVDQENWSLHFSITLTEPVCFASVNLYYTRAMYAALRRALAVSPYITEKIIGKSFDGQDIRLYIATDPAVPAQEKKVVYLQGALHCSEYSGPNTLDALLRYLADGLDGAAELLKKYEFHVTPVLSMGGWANGAQDAYMLRPPYRYWEDSKNLNRDWEDFEMYESKAVHAYLSALPIKPSIAVDLHNGWTDYIHDGASITVMEDLPEAELAEHMRFAKLLITQCDDLAPDRIWHNSSKPWIFKGYMQKYYCPGFTLEFSRYSMYDRAEGKRMPLSQARYRRFGVQFAHVIDAYLSGAQAEE